MKKLLNVLGAIGLVASSTSSVIACGGSSKNNEPLNPFVDNELNKLPTELQSKIKQTSFFTKLLLLSRHENLNYYFNDMFLSTFANGAAASMYTAPTVYSTTYNDQEYNINLGDYINPLMSNYTPLNKVFNGVGVGDGRVTAYSDMIVGMANDNYYQDLLTNISNGNYNFNSMDNYLNAGSTDRNALKWADFDTGALRNYMSSNANTISPDDITKVTRVDHQLYYLPGSLKDGAFKLKADISPTSEDLLFGNSFYDFMSVAKKSHVVSTISNYLPLVQNFNGTDTGMSFGMQFLTAAMPFLNPTSISEEIIFLTILEVIKDLAAIYSDTSFTESDIAFSNKSTFVDAATELNNLITVQYKDTYPKLLSILMSGGDPIKVADFFGTDDSTNLFKVLNKFCSAYSDEINASTFNELAWNTSFVQSKKFSTIKSFIGQIFGRGDSAASLSDPEWLTQINLTGLIGSTFNIYGTIGDNSELFTNISADYSDKSFAQLTKAEKEDIQQRFGWSKSDSTFADGSILSKIYDLVNNEENPGYKALQNIMLSPNSIINQAGSTFGTDLHDNVYQYALLDDYWDISDSEYYQPSTSNTIGATLKYSMTYSGVGDSTVSNLGSTTMDDVNTTGINPRNSQGPWQTKTDDEWVKYDGLGNVEDRIDVQHKYDIEWTNVSNDPNQDYWVITKINFYDLSTGTPIQYYNWY